MGGQNSIYQRDFPVTTHVNECLIAAPVFSIKCLLTCADHSYLASCMHHSIHCFIQICQCAHLQSLMQLMSILPSKTNN